MAFPFFDKTEGTPKETPFTSSCMKIGCPAISMKDNKATVDNTLCVGCGVCEQLCAFGAIGGGR